MMAESRDGVPVGAFAPSRVARKFRRASQRRIVVVHGPAGCGKSVAIAQHVHAVRNASTLYSVRLEDSDVASFARALTDAVIPLVPSAGHFSSAFKSARRLPDPWRAIATWLAGRLDREITIAIDHVDRIEDEAALRFLAQVIDAAPPCVRWVLGTRTTAFLPLPRWLAEGSADASLDESALRIDACEVEELAGALGADAAIVDALRQRYDGSIGPIAEGTSGIESTWKRFSHRAVELLALATLPALRQDVLEQLPAPVATLLDQLAIALPFSPVTIGQAGVRNLDERIRSHAYALAAQSADASREGRLLAARALEECGLVAPALHLYTRALSYDDMRRVLGLHGIDLYDRGQAADIVVAAIDKLPVADRRSTAIELMLEATDESSRGRYDISESWFEHAAALATGPEERTRIEVALTVELLRRSRGDAFDRLQALAGEVTDGALSVSVLSTLATAHAHAGRLDAAAVCIAQALSALSSVDDVAVRATFHHRAAFVALSRGEIDGAELHADVAATLAHEHGNEELVAVARSVSYVVYLSYKDDQERTLEALAQIERAGELSRNALFRRYAMIGSYLVHVERNDVAALRALDRRLDGEELDASIRQAEEGMLPAKALQSAWTGDFARAFDIVAMTAERQPTGETRALRWAEIAIYAALAGKDREALRAHASARRELMAAAVKGSVEGLRTRLYMALAALAHSRVRQAKRSLQAAAPDVERWPRWRPFYELLDALCAMPAESNPELLLSSIAAMHDNGLGGLARLIENLPCDRIGLPALAC